MAAEDGLDAATSAQLLEAVRARQHDEVWRLSCQLTDVAIAQPQVMWPLLLQALAVADPESRLALSSDILEHMVQEDFAFFGVIEAEVRSGNRNLLLALKDCWKFGAAELPENAWRWENLIAQEDEKTARRP